MTFSSFNVMSTHMRHIDIFLTDSSALLEGTHSGRTCQQAVPLSGLKVSLKFRRVLKDWPVVVLE